MSESPASQRWAESLAAWAIPDGILLRAEANPWVFPVAVFAPTRSPAATPSRDRALEELVAGDTVLDVGCGGGAAGLALVPPARRLVGVDNSAELLDLMVGESRVRGVSATPVLGRWPDCSETVEVADVVVCHHVVYNVSDVAPFVQALDQHARRRVVVELSAVHPLSSLNDAWLHFWGIERPSRPTADDFVEVTADLGLAVGVERWERAPREATLEERAALARVRLCLPESREAEVREYLAARPPASSQSVTVWWDRSG